MAPVEILGFTTCSSTNFVWENGGVVDGLLRRIFQLNPPNFRQIVEVISAGELCNERRHAGRFVVISVGNVKNDAVEAVNLFSDPGLRGYGM
jgi:hypothetical protein